MITLILLSLGGLFVASRARQNGGSLPLFTPKTDYKPWSESPPSSAGSAGTGQTNPLSALLGRFTAAFGAPAPYVPLSGPGGATTSPAASGAPSGQAPNALLAAAPGTEPTYSPVRGDLASMSDPRYYWMGPAVDVAIMSDDVNKAMADAGEMDLSASMLEASLGVTWRP